jgi:hypothetical protein
MSFLDRRFAANYSRRHFAGDLAAEDRADAAQEQADADIREGLRNMTEAEQSAHTLKVYEDRERLKHFPIGLTLEQAKRKGYTE